MSCMDVVVLYGHRHLHPYNAGTEHVGFSPTRQTQVQGAERCSASRMED